jgi:hypothetical protein
MATITPILTNFSVAPRAFGSAPFVLTNPVSTNTDSAATFTFTSSNTAVADISGQTVTIISAGQTVITARQAATPGFSSATITANFTVNLATPTITGFTIAPKSFNDISFGITAPSSNSSGVFTFRSLTTDVLTVSGVVATIIRVGRARIEAIQFPATNYTSGSIVAEFDILTSVVRVGVQNQIDLSWNIPIENGATIKNYFFYVEERIADTVPAPPVSTMVTNVTPVNGSYYSYALPTPYSAQIIASNGSPTGIDVNATTLFNINTSLNFVNKNHVDLGYYGEIEISWVYNQTIKILNPNFVASTEMSLSLWKESSTTIGDGRVNLVFTNKRIYDSATNCLGPRPQNNGKTMTDIFNIAFDSTALRALKYLKPTDIISGSIQLSSVSYSPADNPDTLLAYSIIVKSIRIAPFRFPISRDFTTLGFGLGNSAVGEGFAVSTVNASAPLAAGGVLYHMPKMTRSLADFNEAKWSFTLNYAANLTRLATDISFLPVGDGGSITNLNIPYTLRIRGYSRPYSRILAAITVEDYNTTNVSHFLTNIADARYNTWQLFDVSLNGSATYAQLVAEAATAVTQTFDISGVYGFPAFSATQDTSHTQFVFLFQLTVTDASYNAYFRSIRTGVNAAADAFRVKMLSQTMTPRQEYRFAGPDPSLTSSNALTSTTNTLYTITDPYTNIRPFYRFYNLTNGVFYSYKIASNNIVGTSAFSELFTRRCGSIPNTIVNSVNSENTDTLTIESERTSNRVNIYWVKPLFSGYEIQYFVIQTAIDISGAWLNILDYTPDISHNLITFNEFEDTIVPIGLETQVEYNKTINTYIYKSPASAAAFTQRTGIPIGASGSLINGYKYYFRIASVNELGYSAYSTILTGIPFARPANAPIQFIGNPIVGDRLIYLTWKIPQDDAGSPILNYIVDYEEVSDTTGAYSNKRRYKLDIDEPLQNKRPSYPFDDFRTVYAGYKKFDALSSGEQTEISKLRSLLTKYIIPPTPITISDSDAKLTPSSIPNRNVLLSSDSRRFTFISAELTQNVFDISNIQLKWYYFSDPSGEAWVGDATTVSFRMSLRGHLKAVTGSGARDISNIFYIPGDATTGVTYTVTRAKLGIDDITGVYKYINYTNGNIITDGVVPKIFIPTLPSIDASNNSRRYHLQINYEITYISESPNKFLLYSGPIIINGTAPVRTRAGTNTKFTLKLKSNVNSPLVNGIKYRFTITPFNINDYFPDPTNNNRVEVRIGITNSDPITDMSYSLISTSQGGKVRLQWKYSPPSDYYINIQIPRYYQSANFPSEYPYQTFDDNDVARSIWVKNLIPSASKVVTYTIPSDLPADIASGTAQLYLKSGRGYTISVSPIQVVELNNAPISLVAPAQNMFADDTFIIPFRTPLSPLMLSARGNNGLVELKWKLPNIFDDPNYYITDVISNYYRYRYYTLERRDISASSTAPWVVVSSEIEIPTRDNGGVAGYERSYTVSGLINEHDNQFRVRLRIHNEYNGERAFSEWTYMSVINNVAVPESSGNTVYPSLYPYKPSMPLLRFASRTTSLSGTLNVLTVLFVLPEYNGNADKYECEIFYTPVGNFGTNWYNIFDASNGIADTSFNNLILSNGKIVTPSAVAGTEQRINVVCRTTVLAYGIRIRVVGRKNDITNYPYTLYSDYSSVDYIEI